MAFDIGPIRDLGRRIAAEYRFDSYQIVRSVRTPDNSGGSTPTDQVVEDGECNLTTGATRPEERAIADRAGSTTPYVLRNLKHDTVLKASDRVVIDGRTFTILGVLRPAALNVAVTAVAQERS